MARALPDDGLVAVIGTSGAGAWIFVTAALRAQRRVMLLPPRMPEAMLAAIATAFAPDCVRAAGGTDSDEEALRLSALVATTPRPSKQRRAATTRNQERGAHGSEIESAGAGARFGPTTGLLLFSSGTTGRPRAIARSPLALDRVAGTLHAEINFGPHERVLSFLPMHHAYGLEHALLAPIFGGATVEQRSTSGPDAASLIVARRISVLPATPILIDALANTSDTSMHGPTAHALRRVYSAGSALPETIAARMQHSWGIRADDLYGASELGTITLSNEQGRHTVDGVVLRVVDPDIHDALVDRAPGVRGEVVVHSDAMFDGYIDDRHSAPRLERTIDGFFRTGDLGVIDADGPRIVGRLKLQFDVGGLKVNAEEVERVLASAHGVAHAVVVPMTITATLQRLRAFIEPRPGATIDLAELARIARAHLSPHEVPRDFEIVATLPRTPSGKLLRGALMERAAAVP